MNPIEIILGRFFVMIHNIPEGARGISVVFIIGLIMMLYAMSRRNLLGGQDREYMRVYSGMSATMNDRIAELTPYFAESIALLAQRYGDTLQADGNMVGFIKSIDGSVKEKAEIDYCLRDCKDDDAVADLANKLETLLKPENKNV